MPVTVTSEMSLSTMATATPRGVRTTAFTLGSAGVLVPPIKCRMHVLPRLAGAISLPAGFKKRGHHATRLTEHNPTSRSALVLVASLSSAELQDEVSAEMRKLALAVSL
jgi:hypothetical protein